MRKNIDINTDKILIEVAESLGINTKSLLASSLVSDDTNIEDSEDNDLANALNDNIEEDSDSNIDSNESNNLDNVDDNTEPETQPTNVGPYDLAFQLKRISVAFTQVVTEADKLKKLTETITSNMTPEQQAEWIEERRFFIETAKEAEIKWGEFKKTLLQFSLTPKI